MTEAQARNPIETNRDAALRALYDAVHRNNLFPFWATSTDVEHDEIKQLMGTQKAVPHRWSYKNDIEPILYRAAELVTMDDSRAPLADPGQSRPGAAARDRHARCTPPIGSTTPHEVMPPHRHSPNAIRFGLTGKGNFTGVEGEDITFGPGDMVLTPHDTWHNHGNVGNEPAINLSVLDLPLVETLNAIYFEHDYTRDGRRQARQEEASRPRRVPTDYSAARSTATAGCMPRFVSHHRGTGDVLADVCLSLGHDARAARALQGLGRRSLRGADDRICRSD